MEPDEELRRVVLRAFPEARIEACEALSGGISARAVVVDVVLEGGSRKRVVVRRPSRSTMEEKQRVVSTEHALLSRCSTLGIPAPEPCFLDLEAAAVVLEHVEGSPNFAPESMAEMLEQMAATLARIHGIGLTRDLDFLPRRSTSFQEQYGRAPEQLDLSLDEPRIRAVLSELWPFEQRNTDSLLHGDYWPGNLLWRDGKLAAVLDWEGAAVGDPLADLAIARLDLVWAFGEPAMREFTERYRKHRSIDWQNLAHWDLAVSLRPMSNLHRWAPSYAPPPINRPDVTETSMREGHRRFAQQALDALGKAST